MDKRFRNLFNLTEAEAIALLDKPLDQLGEDDSRYIAASHLANFPTEASINALIRAIHNTEPSLDNRIVRRESVKSLGKLQTNLALPAIQTCLADDDCYTVETAVWAIGEIGTQDPEILAEIAQLLEKPGQIYRVIIHTLAKLNYQPALDRIRKFVDDDDKTIASAAMSAVYRFTGDYAVMENVVALLQHSNVNARRGCIQDLIDCQYYAAIPNIARCPVSLVFRLRGIRLMGEAGIPAGKISFADIQPSLEQVLRDHPNDLDLVHVYDQTPSLEFLIRELYQTDFGRCYLATKTLLEVYPEAAPAALLATYAEEAYNDYGAHYHVMKLFGWLKYAPAYNLLIEALDNRQPQFQKSRAAAAIALGELGDQRAIEPLKTCLETKIWDLKYTALMALEKLGDTSSHKIAANDPDWLVRAKADFQSKI
ncbi:MAG TPA: phycocyanin operon protein Y [Cyanobacteria bacterium UBA11369]|nr:phycocyanin operon protein Y [Cyanobacteria bacterium UBA11371]HBE32948.1 phycocyanin operon protein Y [Cyanobacteria bacterium UBA11368]HBE51008.1 phycocyanin operon protein Y [Cyanobacteria bacterium UBA11369]